MSVDDYVDFDPYWDGFYDEPEYVLSGSIEYPKKCNRCDVGGLYWCRDGSGKWILVDINDNPHVCDFSKDFEGIE